MGRYSETSGESGQTSGFQGEARGLVAVELSDGEALDRRRPQEGHCGIEVILAKGRRIELSLDFDAVQLRLLRVSSKTHECRAR